MPPVRRLCQDCNGKGAVKILHQDNSEGNYWSIVQCDACKGRCFVTVDPAVTTDSPTP